jgi:hypothetical protein
MMPACPSAFVAAFASLPIGQRTSRGPRPGNIGIVIVVLALGILAAIIFMAQ